MMLTITRFGIRIMNASSFERNAAIVEFNELLEVEISVPVVRYSLFLYHIDVGRNFIQHMHLTFSCDMLIYTTHIFVCLIFKIWHEIFVIFIVLFMSISLFSENMYKYILLGMSISWQIVGQPTYLTCYKQRQYFPRI
jgi:hypothetical protein